MFAGAVIVGGSLSTMVTVKEALAVLPEASMAEPLTVVVPIGKALPEGGLVLVVTPGQLSLAVNANVTSAEGWPRSVFTVMFAGAVILGGSVSFTVRVKLALEVFPEGSIAVPVTVVTPLGKALPEGGLLVTLTKPELSVAPKAG